MLRLQQTEPAKKIAIQSCFCLWPFHGHCLSVIKLVSAKIVKGYFSRQLTFCIILLMAYLMCYLTNGPQIRGWILIQQLVFINRQNRTCCTLQPTCNLSRNTIWTQFAGKIASCYASLRSSLNFGLINHFEECQSADVKIF